MKVLFIGQSSPFTMIPLEAVGKEHDIVGLVESAPRSYQQRNGWELYIKKWLVHLYRKCRSTITLKSIADNKSVPYFFLTRENRDDFVQFISDVKPDIICVAQMSQLLKKEAYSLPVYGSINFHPSLLPNYRGPNPWFWQYYYLEKEVGATIHYIDDGEDTGDILKQGKIKVRLGMPPDELMESVCVLGSGLMLEALEEIKNGNANPVEQRYLECPVRARNVSRKEQLLEWNKWPIERVWHVLRGTGPWIDSLPSRIPGVNWRVQNYDRCSSRPPWGKRGISRKGWYLRHPEGVIYIRLEVTRGRFFCHLSRKR